MNHLTKLYLLIISSSFLFGCATPERNIRLAEEFWQNPKPKVAIARIHPESKPCLLKLGNQGLLDFAINSAVTNKLDRHLEKISFDWYHEELPQKFVTELKRRNISAQIHEKSILPKQKKSASVIVEVAGDKLLLLELQGLGAVRNYYSFIPSSAPKAYCNLKGELIDRQDKKVLWRHFAKIEEVVQGEWDQPPHYPNLTNALKLAISSAQEEVIDSFFSGH